MFLIVLFLGDKKNKKFFFLLKQKFDFDIVMGYRKIKQTKIILINNLVYQ